MNSNGRRDDTSCLRERSGSGNDRILRPKTRGRTTSYSLRDDFPERFAEANGICLAMQWRSMRRTLPPPLKMMTAATMEAEPVIMEAVKATEMMTAATMEAAPAIATVAAMTVKAAEEILTLDDRIAQMTAQVLDTQAATQLQADALAGLSPEIRDYGPQSWACLG